MPFPFPFQPTASPLVVQPKVTIEFAGQMILQPGTADTDVSRTCEIGINRFSKGHMLQVLLTVKTPTEPPTVIPLLTGPLTDDFMIRLGPDAHLPPNPAARPGDFRVFAPTVDPFDRHAAGNNNHDYRWALNLRHPNIHPNATRTNGAEPVVKLRTGTLYSPRLTPVELNPRLERDGSTILLNKVPPELAASIVPPSGTHVLLEWNDMGDRLHRVLPREEDHPDTIYTVSFINDPPANSPSHEELALYYKVLQASGVSIPQGQRFQLKFDDASGTDRIPCLSVVLNP